MAFAPAPKVAGDLIKSKDWNDALAEVVRLELAKLNNTGGSITGPLTVAGALGVGPIAPDRTLTVSGASGTYLNVKGDNGTEEVLLGADAGGGIVSTITNHDLQLRAGANVTRMILKANGNVGVNTNSPLYKLHVVAPGGVGGEDANGVSLAGAVPLVAQSNSTAFAILNAAGRQAFALNIDGTSNAANARGIPTFYDKFDGNWHNSISLMNGFVGIGTNAPYAQLTMTGSIGFNDAVTPMLFIYPAGGNTPTTLSGPRPVLAHSPQFPTWGLAYRDSDDIFIFQRQGASVMTVNLGSNEVVVAGKLTVQGGKVGYITDQFVNNLDEPVEEGDVVTVSKRAVTLYYGQNNAIPIVEIELAQQAYDTRVCGVVAELYAQLAPTDGAVPNSNNMHTATRESAGKALELRSFSSDELESLDRTQVQTGHVGGMVTLGAYAHCKVDADIAPITAGDLLTTSSTKGHAQKVLEPSKAVGAIIGKALGSLAEGKGKIPVLVLLH